jgi:hypothetical protein
LTEIASGSVYSQQAKSSQRLLLYPLFFIIFWIPATINRFLLLLLLLLYVLACVSERSLRVVVVVIIFTNRTLEASGHSVFAVTYLECFFLPLQGITNTLIYLFTSQAHKVR